jgi:hypothetical protein
MKWLASGIPHGQGESKSDALPATQAAIDAEIKLIEKADWDEGIYQKRKFAGSSAQPICCTRKVTMNYTLRIVESPNLGYIFPETLLPVI